MSKIPYVDSSKEEQTQGKKKFWNKGFIISLIVAFLLLLLTAGLIAMIEYYSLQNAAGGKDEKLVLHILVDAFSLSGLLGLAFYALSFISSQGAFDILAYGIQVVFLVTFRPKYRETSFPKTFYDYKVLKNAKKRKPFLAILLISAIFLIVAIILLIIYHH